MSVITFDDEYFMRQAIKEAEYALNENEVPVGCVIACNDKIISRGHNMTERLNDSTSHAEILAITSAEEYLGSKYLNGCTLYVTLEPCLMCAGAINLSHISKIVFGAKDNKRGYSVFCNPFSDKTKIVHGVLEEECSFLIKDFFAGKRNKKQ